MHNSDFLSVRLENLYRKLEKLNLDGFFVSNQTNITYLTNFNSRDAYLLINLPLKETDKKPRNFFITDFRYWQEAKENLKGFFIEKLNGSIFKKIVNLSKLLKIKRLGFEAKYLPYAEYEKIKEDLSLNTELVPTYDLIDSLREIKSTIEIQRIKKATEINIEAFHYAKRIIRRGLTEREVARKLEDFIKKKGAKPAFETIVAFGPNSSFPHHISSDYKIKNSEVILVDMGVDFQGYKSDLTRVFFLGKIPHIIRKIQQIVIKAQELALEALTSKVPINKIDKTARDYIKERGYGRFFGHALGHGIGLEVHEEPYISSKNKNIIKNGMVFTLEPAIYLPGKFGIRIEDMVWFNEDKVEVLSAPLNK
jgi:Xaa-Pro aminopeptidase